MKTKHSKMLLPNKVLKYRFWRQKLGQAGEQHVVNMLTKKGWQIVERNWRAGRYAEIDIIAYDPQGILVFIEVKTRMAATATSGFSSLGYDKLDRRKVQKLLGCVRLYMAKMKSFHRSQEEGCRIDAFIVNYPIISHSDQIDLAKTIANLVPKVDHIMGFIH